MRVLHIGSQCGFGGIETMLATLISEQIKSGIEADIYYIEDIGGAKQYEGICRVIFAKDKRLGRLLLETQYDVIHAVTWATRMTDITKSLKRGMYNGPVVVTAHGFRGWETRLEYDCITAVSEYVAQSIRDRSDQVLCIYNGIDTSRFYRVPNVASGPPILAWVGRSHDPDKDFVGVAALAQTAAAKNFRWMIIDGSSEHNELCTPWLPDNTEIIHRIAHHDMPEFYRQVAASGGFLLSTSVREGFGLNIIEASACGCPVVAPAVGAIPELISDRATGVLYNRCDGVRGVIAAIEWLYLGDHYSLVANRASEHVRTHFSAQTMCEAYTKVYKRVISEHNPPSLRSVVTRTILSHGYKILRKVRQI